MVKAFRALKFSRWWCVYCTRGFEGYICLLSLLGGRRGYALKPQPLKWVVKANSLNTTFTVIYLDIHVFISLKWRSLSPLSVHLHFTFIMFMFHLIVLTFHFQLFFSFKLLFYALHCHFTFTVLFHEIKFIFISTYLCQKIDVSFYFFSTFKFLYHVHLYLSHAHSRLLFSNWRSLSFLLIFTFYSIRLTIIFISFPIDNFITLNDVHFHFISHSCFISCMLSCKQLCVWSQARNTLEVSPTIVHPLIFGVII